MKSTSSLLPCLFPLFVGITGCQAETSDQTITPSPVAKEPTAVVAGAPLPCGSPQVGGNGAVGEGMRLPVCDWILGADALIVARVDGVRAYLDEASAFNTAPGAQSSLVDCVNDITFPAWVLDVTPWECVAGDCPKDATAVHFGAGHEMSPNPRLENNQVVWHSGRQDRDIMPAGSYVGLPLRRDEEQGRWSLYGMNTFGWDADGVIAFDENAPSLMPDVPPGTTYAEFRALAAACIENTAGEAVESAREYRRKATGNAYYTYAARCGQ